MGGFFCVLFLLLSAVRPVHGEELELYATAAVLMDADSGRVLYGKNEDAVMAMASTTKIMTCIVVLETVSQDDILTVSAYAASMPKVKLYIQKGEQYTVRDLLHSLMLESHNDAAVALAEYVGKQFLPRELQEKDTSEYTAEESKMAMAAFAAQMNRKAAELGVPVMFHSNPCRLGFHDNCAPDKINRMIQVFPDLEVITAHLGGMKWQDAVSGCTWVDMSYILPKLAGLYGIEQVNRILRAFGPERLIFATDFPDGEYDAYFDILDQMDFSDAEIEQIAWGNIAGLLAPEDRP